MAPTEFEQRQIRERIKSFLDESGSYVAISVSSFSIEEDLRKKASSIVADLSINNKKTKIKGVGVGIVDALLRGLVDKLSKNYPSLKNIKISEFNAKAKIKKKARPGSDAVVDVDLVLENTRGGKIIFSHSAKSLNISAVLVVLESVEYFINSEIAFLKLKTCIENASLRRRSDLVNDYMFLMTEVVKNMNYDKILTKGSK